MKAQGHAPVRVRRVEPSERDRERLRKGKSAATLPPLPATELQRLRERLAIQGR
jgi:rare lipoprotein A